MFLKTNVHVHIATPTEVLWSGEAVSVTAPASEGEVTILPHHEAFASALGKGRLTVRTKERSETFDVKGGVLEVSANSVTVLL